MLILGRDISSAVPYIARSSPGTLLTSHGMFHRCLDFREWVGTFFYQESSKSAESQDLYLFIFETFHQTFSVPTR